MLTVPYTVQQFLAACIGNTEEENDPSVSDAQQNDEHQAESEFAADANSTNDAESEASDASDTPVPEPSEIENTDAPSESGEIPAEDDVAPVAIADDDSPETQPDSEVLPMSIAEEAHASEDDIPDTPSTAETPAVETANPAPSDETATEPSEDTDPVSEDETKSATERVISEQESEAAVAQHAQVSDGEVDKGEVTPPLPQETDRGSDTETEASVPEVEEEPISLKLGIIEEVYDFVEMFGQSTVSGTDQASVSGMDCSGGVTKPAIFEHPTPTETAKIDYTLSLPEVDKKEKLFLHFFHRITGWCCF